MHDRKLTALDLNLLVVLRALLSERHVTRAATRVGLSQSATSHALARLRELYRDPLLVRSARGLQLTPRAVRLLPTLERGLSDLLSVVDSDPLFEPLSARHTFTIGMADYAQALLLGPLLRSLAVDAPHVDLAVVTFPNATELIEAGSVDLALMIAGSESPKLPSLRLFDDEFSCLVRRDHPRVKRKLSLERYVAERHVVVAPSGTPGSIVDTELAARGLERRIALRVSNFLIAPLVVCETDFINTMPVRLARQMARNYPLRLLPPPLDLPHFGFTLSWHSRLDHDPAQRWLREFVARVCKSV